MEMGDCLEQPKMKESVLCSLLDYCGFFVY